jgi:hypothetical protein
MVSRLGLNGWSATPEESSSWEIQEREPPVSDSKTTTLRNPRSISS